MIIQKSQAKRKGQEALIINQPNMFCDLELQLSVCTFWVLFYCSSVDTKKKKVEFVSPSMNEEKNLYAFQLFICLLRDKRHTLIPQWYFGNMKGETKVNQYKAIL